MNTDHNHSLQLLARALNRQMTPHWERGAFISVEDGALYIEGSTGADISNLLITAEYLQVMPKVFPTRWVSIPDDVEVRCNLNGIHKNLTVSPETVEELRPLVAEINSYEAYAYHRKPHWETTWRSWMEESRRDYENSPQYAEDQRRLEQEKAERNAHLSELLEQLDEIKPGDHEAFLEWMKGFALPNDYIHSTFDKADLAEKVKALGYESGFVRQVGFNGLPALEEEARWIASAAIDCLSSGMPIHPKLGELSENVLARNALKGILTGTV